MRPTIAGSVAFVFRFTVAPALVCFSVALCALWLRQPGPYRGLTRDQYMAAMHLTNMRYCERHGIPLSDAPPIPEYPGLRTDVPRHGGARKHGALVLGMAAVSLVVSAFSIATPVAAAPEWRLTRTGFWTPAAEALWSQTRRISIDHSVSTHTRSYGFGAVRQGQTRVDFRTVAVIQRNGSARTLMWSNDRNDHGLLSDPLRWPQMRFWALALERFAPHVELTYEGDGSTDHEPDKRVVVRAPTRRAELRRQP